MPQQNCPSPLQLASGRPHHQGLPKPPALRPSWLSGATGVVSPASTLLELPPPAMDVQQLLPGPGDQSPFGGSFAPPAPFMCLPLPNDGEHCLAMATFPFLEGTEPTLPFATVPSDHDLLPTAPQQPQLNPTGCIKKDAEVATDVDEESDTALCLQEVDSGSDFASIREKDASTSADSA